MARPISSKVTFLNGLKGNCWRFFLISQIRRLSLTVDLVLCAYAVDLPEGATTATLPDNLRDRIPAVPAAQGVSEASPA
jgi:hypothetical protein